MYRMSTRMAVGIAGVVMGIGCGPSVGDGDDEARCAGDEPFKLFDLDDGEMVAGPPTRIGDRVYQSIGDAVTTDDIDPESMFALASPTNPRMVSFGLCGESPREIADGFRYVFEMPQWPGVVLSRADLESPTVMLDPQGVAAPVDVLPPMPSLGAVDTDFGLAYIAAEGDDLSRGPLVLQPYPENPGDPVPAARELLSEASTNFGSLAAAGNTLLVLTPAGEILEIDLAKDTTTTLVEGASAMELRADGEWLAFQHPGTPMMPADERITSVLERSTGVVTEVARGTEHLGYAAFADDLVVPLGGSDRLVRIPSFETFDLPLAVSLHERIDDDHYLGSNNSSYVRLDVTTGDSETLMPFTINYRVDDGELDALVMNGGGIGKATQIGEWWRAPLASGEGRMLAGQATGIRGVLANGDAMTLVDVDDTYRGRLVRVDEDGAQELVDERVTWFGASLGGDAFGDGVAVWGVMDGDRSGIWRIGE